MQQSASIMESAQLAASQPRNVVVIGAGLVGLCSALWLQRAGHRVTIIDRDPPLPGSSYRHACSYGNACTVATYAIAPVATPGIARRVPAMLADAKGPLAIMWNYLPRLAPWLRGFLASSSPAEVERISKALALLMRDAEAAYAPLHAEAGTGHLLRRDGALYLYQSEAEFLDGHANIDLYRRRGVNIEIVDRDAIRELEPNLAPLYHRGIWFRDGHHLDSPKAVAFAFANLFQQRGGTFISGEVQGLVSTGVGVQAKVGAETLEADRVVVAAGAWSRRLAKMVGDDILLDTERGYHVLYPDAAGLLNRPVCFAERGFYMVPLTDGLRAAGTVELGGLEAPMRKARTEAIRKGVTRFVPGAGHPTDDWMGFRPSMPDSLPVIGRSPTEPRVSYAFGHGHVGVTLAGVTGRLITDLVSDRQPYLDLSAFRPIRFNRWGRPMP